MPDVASIESLSAVTLIVADMNRAVTFYEKVGFRRLFGDAGGEFVSFAAGSGYVNLMLDSGAAQVTGWGRVILYVSDVDAMHAQLVAAGLEPLFVPRDGEWGERYFHIKDPDGHELSFARPIDSPSR